MGVEPGVEASLGRHTVLAVLVRARWVTWEAVSALPKGAVAATRDAQAAGRWVRDLLDGLGGAEREALDRGVGAALLSSAGRALSEEEVEVWTTSARGVEIEEDDASELVESLERLVEGDGSVEDLVEQVSEVVHRDGVLDRTLRSLQELEPGTRVHGQYELEGLLGVGGFGVVYAARNVHELKPTSLALKLLRGEERASRRLERRLQREFSLLEEHAQPGLVRVKAMGRCETHGL